MTSIEADKKSHLQVAMLRSMNEDWSKALTEYTALADQFPGDPFILEPLSRVQHKLGMNEACAQTLAKAIQGYRTKGLYLKAAKVEAHLVNLATPVPA